MVESLPDDALLPAAKETPEDLKTGGDQQEAPQQDKEGAHQQEAEESKEKMPEVVG